MSRPATHDEYLASLVPDSVKGVSRRTLLRGALGAGTLLAAPSLLTACGGDGGSSSGAATGTVSTSLREGLRKRTVTVACANASAARGTRRETVTGTTTVVPLSDVRCRGAPTDVTRPRVSVPAGSSTVTRTPLRLASV